MNLSGLTLIQTVYKKGIYVSPKRSIRLYQNVYTYWEKGMLLFYQ